MVVAYKLSPMTYRCARLLIRLGQFGLTDLGYFSLVNLIAGKEVVVELLQEQVQADAIAAELCRLVDDEEPRRRQIAEFAEVRKKLGDSGASDRAAELALSLLVKP